MLARPEPEPLAPVVMGGVAARRQKDAAVALSLRTSQQKKSEQRHQQGAEEPL